MGRFSHLNFPIHKNQLKYLTKIIRYSVVMKTIINKIPLRIFKLLANKISRLNEKFIKSYIIYLSFVRLPFELR